MTCAVCHEPKETRPVAIRWSGGDVGQPFECCGWCEREVGRRIEKHGRLVAPDGTALKPR